MTIKDVVMGEDFMARPEGYYDSTSKGLIKIKNMSTTHLRNAIKKLDNTVSYTVVDGEMIYKNHGCKLPVYQELLYEFSTRDSAPRYVTRSQLKELSIDS